MGYSLDKKEVFEKLKTSEEGLSEKEALKRLVQYGKNELKQINKINPFFLFLEQFKSIFTIILLVAAIFSILIQHYIDFAVLVIIIILNSAIGFFQQYKAEKIILKMRNMLIPKVKVIRDGKVSEIPSINLVPGDLMIVSEGDKITADCRLISVNELQANEAVLTGESFPQDKFSEKISADTILSSRTNMIYAGTIIARGSGKAIVVETGMKTEFGKIAEQVQEIKTEKTPLEHKLEEFSKKIAVFALVAAFIIIIIGIYRGEEIFQMILSGIALAVSVIPEGLPAIISVTLALAIGRMQKHNALVRKLPAAETLGRVSVICTDKTGTLTKEEISVTELYCGGKSIKMEGNSFYLNKKKISPLKEEDLVKLLRAGIMCNNARLESEGKKLNIFGDATEKALVMSAYHSGFIKKDELEKEARVKEYPFSFERKMMSIVRESKGNYINYVKGAPDRVIKKCSKELINGKIVSLNERRKEELLTICNNMSSNALRVLGFAYKEIPHKFNQEIAENNLIFLGFQGMFDAPRKEVKKAILDCKNAGIKIKMITGDSELTAKAVAKAINLEGESIDWGELEKASYEEFRKIVRQKTIFSRVTPEIKLRIIQSLKEDGEIVAVTGDGVNDILALKEAHIGIAMGIRGTDVARDAADIILLDDNFSTIAQAVREGRRVYDNMKKSIKLNLSTNLDELFVITSAILFSLPLPLLPLSILWMNLVTDSLPSLALSVEKEEENIMMRKPNNEKNILNGGLKFIIIAGIFSFIATMSLFLVFYEADLNKARTMALTASVFSELFIALACRSSEENIWKLGLFSNKAMMGAIGLAVLLQLAVIYTPLSNLFGLTAISIGELGLTFAVASLGFIFFECCKYFKVKI